MQMLMRFVCSQQPCPAGLHVRLVSQVILDINALICSQFSALTLKNFRPDLAQELLS